MSELVLVRHGQASFGAQSYDKLSPAGIAQIKQLSRHWQDLGERFDAIYSGSLQRQQETAAELLHHVHENPVSPQTHEGFNEYNGDPLMGIYLRDHAAKEGFEAGLRLPIHENRLFQKVFEAATAKWIRHELQPQQDDVHFEFWGDFRKRVHTAIDELMERHQNNSKVLISTSGGVIALALQRVLHFPDEKVIATNWMVHNSSVTRIRYGNGKVSLTLFNNLAHLEKPELKHMVTYR
jgi:broad specificity phosphatase PhoE